jgi:glycosyltransferase involved in cell wall biosynthesis
MRNLVKKIYFICPKKIKKLLVFLYDYYGYLYCKIKNTNSKKQEVEKNNTKKRILFYHISGLSFGGTEKSLQIIAKYMDKNKYEIFFMYSPKNRKDFSKRSDGRMDYLKEKEIRFIPFDYDFFEEKWPYFISKMHPHILKIIEGKKIDILITSTDGHSEFPINLIRDIPIILINIFGAPTLQKNIKKNICISHEVAQKISGIVSKNKVNVIYIQSEEPISESVEMGKKIRENFDIKETDFVFGRIGRADNEIFDSIGIEAFKKIQREYPNAHYIIISPPPILVEMVNKEKIHNIHFLPPSSKELDIWGFHQSIDCLAHFRKDGESCGLNIAESMLCGKPIISHRSHQWNAHIEYLDDDFSRIANIGNVDQYANFMRELIEDKKSGKIIEMGKKSRIKAESLFLIKNNISKIENIVEEVIK